MPEEPIKIQKIKLRAWDTPEGVKAQVFCYWIGRVFDCEFSTWQEFGEKINLYIEEFKERYPFK